MEGTDPNRAASAAPDEAALHQGLGGGGHDPYAAWRSANFRIFIAGNTCISLGLLMVSTAINYQIFHLTGLPRSVAWLGLAQALPVILLSLPAGQTADRHSRKMIMVVTAVLLLTASLCLAVLTGARLSKWQTEAMLLALASAEAAAGTFFRPARNALLASLVPAADFANAVTWNSTLWELASVIGPAAAGWLIAVDIRTTYAAAAVLQLVMIPAMLILRARPDNRSRPVLPR
jgi:MFS family permease